MSHVSVRNLGIAYGTLNIIEDLSLDIAPGEFLVLLGPSGCGKTTLLNAIAGLADISKGQIWIAGNNVTWKEPKDRQIGMVFQSYALYPRMTVEGNMSFGLSLTRMKKEEIKRRVAGAARTLQLEPLMKRMPTQLSGGQRQRVAIGRALVRDVEVFLFDEPLSNLDAKLRTELRVELKKLHISLGTTMIYVTHDQVEAMTLADRIAVMKGGTIQQLAAPKEIYSRPANIFVAGFVGSPGINFFQGKFGTLAGNPAIVLDGGGQALDLSGYQFTSAPVEGQPIVLGVRPEQFSRNTAATSRLEAVVTLVDTMGADSLVWGAVGDSPVSWRSDNDQEPNIGERVSIAFQPARASLFDAASGQRV